MRLRVVRILVYWKIWGIVMWGQAVCSSMSWEVFYYEALSEMHNIHVIANGAFKIKFKELDY